MVDPPPVATSSSHGKLDRSKSRMYEKQLHDRVNYVSNAPGNPPNNLTLRPSGLNEACP